MSTFAKKVTSAVAALSIAFSIVSPIAGVSAAYTSVDAANKLATLGVIVDQSANPADYRLGDTLTRNEGVKVMMNLSSVTVVDNCEGKFSDLTSADWACKYAETALANGMVAGNASFNGSRLLSNIEALKMVFQGRDLERNENADWRAGYVEAGVEMGINNAFTDYDTAVTRGQFFIWAANAIDAEDVVVEDDLLCEILGTCDDEEDEEDDVVVVPSGDDYLEVSLSPLSPTANVVAGGKPRTAILAFDVTAGSSDVTLDQVTLEYIGLSTDGDLKNLAVYIGNDKVTKGDSKSFDNDGESELSFENDTVIKAGETKTLVVTSNVTVTNNNVAHQIRVMDLEASSDVVLGTVKSVVFDVVNASNTATLDISVDKQTGKETIGDEVTFADFDVEADDKEDVVVKSMTFDFGSGSVDVEDDIADLALYADGVLVTDDLMLNSDDEVIVDLDYTIEADEEVTFKLMGVITGSIGDKLEVILTDIYAVGADTGVIASLDGNMASSATPTTAYISEVEGAEINVSWDKGDIDEVKPDTKDVLVGTLNLDPASDYLVNEIKVTVTVSTGAVEDVLADIELGGQNPDSEATLNTATGTYTFEDINLSAGVEEMLELMVEIQDDATINDTTVKFDIVIVEVEDEDNDETYTAGGNPDLDTILSSNSFDPKSIDIETASYTLTQTTISKRDLVLGNGVEVVLYQGKLNVGDSDSVTFEDITFTGSTSLSGSVELEDIIDTVTLNIGGVTENGDVNNNDVEFTNADIEVAAGANNVEVLVTAVLKDDDAISNGNSFYVSLKSGTAITAKDSNSDNVADANEKVNFVSGTNVIALNENGTFSIAVVQDGANDDDIEDVVLAGTAGVTLAEVELEAEEEDMDVKELRFTLSGAFDTTVKNVRLMDGSTVIADGATVTLSGSDTTIEFEDFTVEDTGSKIEATLVADLEIITDEGGVPTATAGKIIVKALSATDMDVEGASSNDDITGTFLVIGTSTSKEVAVTPVLITASIVSTLGNNDEYAEVMFDIDFGNNELDNDSVYLSGITLESVTGTPLVRNDDGTLITTTTGATTITVTTLDIDSEVQDGDVIEFDANGADGSEIRVLANGFTFVLDLNDNNTADAGEFVTSSNTNTLNFGQYNDIN